MSVKKPTMKTSVVIQKSDEATGSFPNQELPKETSAGCVVRPGDSRTLGGLLT